MSGTHDHRLASLAAVFGGTGGGSKDESGDKHDSGHHQSTRPSATSWSFAPWTTHTGEPAADDAGAASHGHATHHHGKHSEEHHHHHHMMLDGAQLEQMHVMIKEAFLEMGTVVKQDIMTGVMEIMRHPESTESALHRIGSKHDSYHAEVLHNIQGVVVHTEMKMKQVESRVAMLQGSLDKVLTDRRLTKTLSAKTLSVDASPSERLEQTPATDRSPGQLSHNTQHVSIGNQVHVGGQHSVGDRTTDLEAMVIESMGVDHGRSFTEEIRKRGGDADLRSEPDRDHDSEDDIEQWQEHVRHEVHSFAEHMQNTSCCMVLHDLLFVTDDAPENQLSFFVQSALFNMFSMLVIAASVLVAALEADANINAAHKGEALDREVYTAVNQVLQWLFLIELLLRIIGLRTTFITGHDRFWNLLDFAVVVAAFLDEYALSDRKAKGTGTLRVLRGIRIVKQLKLLRFLRIFTSLRRLVGLILDCLGSLIWAMVLLFLLIIAIGIFILQGTAEYVRDSFPDVEHPAVEMLDEYFPSLEISCLSLLQSVSGGLQWGMVYNSLHALGGLYQIVYLTFVVFVVLGVFKVITSVFVMVAQENINPEVSAMVDVHRRDFFITTLTRLLTHHRDTKHHSGDSVLSRQQLMDKVESPDVAGFLNQYNLDKIDCEVVFTMVAQGGDRANLNDFIVGAFRLAAPARCSDLALIAEKQKATLNYTKFAYQDLRAKVKKVQRDLEED